MSGTRRDELSVYGAEHAYPRFLAGGKGKCADPPPGVSRDDFTDETLDKAAGRRRYAAQLVCTDCPFRRPCAEWAIVTFQQGVYGGTTTLDRRAIRQRRAAQ